MFWDADSDSDWETTNCQNDVCIIYDLVKMKQGYISPEVLLSWPDGSVVIVSAENLSF